MPIVTVQRSRKPNKTRQNKSLNPLTYLDRDSPRPAKRVGGGGKEQWDGNSFPSKYSVVIRTKYVKFCVAAEA